MADQEVGDGDAGTWYRSTCPEAVLGNGGAGKGEDAVVVQQRLQAVLLQIDLSADVDRVPATGGAEDIAQAVDVVAG